MQLQTKFAMVDIIAELHIGADILLAYFHYCCKGFQPFALDWNAAETTSMAELDVDQVRFIKNTATYVKTNEPRFREIRERCLCEDEHYFIAQLYEEAWTPRATSA